MDDTLYFNDHHLAVREMVRAFARDEVAPVASQFDESQEFPWDNVKKMAGLGLLGIPWSESLGGAGLDTMSFIIAIEELARVCASHSITISAHTTLGTSPIVNFGSDAQKKRFVPLLASGSCIRASPRCPAVANRGSGPGRLIFWRSERSSPARIIPRW